MSEQLIKTPSVFGENGNFLLERELGTGGMGGVYMGRDKMLDRPVAVKVMLKEYGDDPEFVEKFKKEAQSAARLIHPNIAQIYSYGICEGMPYIAMELASGGSLYSMMTAGGGKTDITRVIKICQQVAQALQCASDQGFVHGDIKPENILLDANGNAKLVDFGLAGMQKDTDEIWGTPYYISPEKVRKEQVDFRSDMYSLGGTLYHALTGAAPFEGEDSIAVVRKRFDGAPKKPSEIRPDISAAIDELVMKMLAFERENRYPSFEALIAAFRDVLTSGLTVTSGASSVDSAEKTSGSATSGRRTTVVRGRRVMMKRPNIKRKSRIEQEEETEGAEAETPEEEEGGNLGVKVVGVVIGVILLVAAVIGGLFWFKAADSKARAADEQSQISGGINTARQAISDTMASATRFADEFDAFAAKAVVECQKPTDELMKILPEEQRGSLKPSPTKELLDAIASTNESAKAASSGTSTNASDATSAAVSPAVAKAIAEAAALPKFREPTEEEKDPASPEGEAYLKAKKQFMEEQMKARKEGKGKVAAESAPAGDAAAGETKSAEAPAAQTSEAVLVMNDLWTRAYGCQACAIRIRQAVNKLLAKGAEADQIRDTSKQSMDTLVDLSRTLVDQLEQIKLSKDVDYVKKGISYIKSKGEKTVSSTLKQIKLAKIKADREAAAAAAAAAEEKRKQEKEEARQAKIAEETSAAKAKFDAIATQGCFRQLDWKNSLRMLKAMKDEFVTTEGQLAADLQIRKVNDMKMVHDIFLKNLKGHIFKGKLKGCKVEEVNEKEIVLYKPGSQSKVKIPWNKFYRDYHGNVNEIMNVYVVNARLPGAKYKITSLLEWANAVTGAALTMQLVFSDVNGAIQRSEKLMQTVVAQFPEYEKTAKEIFPEMSFEEKKEEE